MKKEEFSNFVGIDVSKKTLDVFMIVNKAMDQMIHQQFCNDTKGIKALISFVKKHKGTVKNTLFCLEHTGIYGRELSVMLTQNQFCVWVEMPVAILRSMGLQRGKNDKVDAKRIAIYALKNVDQVRLWQGPRKEVEHLRQLMMARQRLLNSLKSLKMPINEFKKTGNVDLALVIENSTNNAIEGIERDLKKVDLEIDNIVKNDTHLAKLYGLISSVPGIGKVTTIELICFTNEFNMYKEPKQLACYCGVAPFEYRSGSSIKGRPRVNNMANKSLKTKLHMCAMAAIQTDKELKQYYKRKVDEGKNKMLVINAVRNKLVHRITAVIKRESPFIYRNVA